MGKYEYLNLRQKMVKIRKKVPKLIRKRYSEEVPYDFVRLDDIYEYLTPALNKYGVDFEVAGETPTQVDSLGNLVYLIPFGAMWRYEADLKVCWVNADHPDEKTDSVIHVVGTNEVPDKAKGAAWSYGLKYYLLNKFNIVQASTEDPDMRGSAPDGDKTKKETKEEKSGETEETKKSAKKQVSESNPVKSEPKKKEAKEESEHPPKSDSYAASAEETRQSLKQNEKNTLKTKTVRNGNAVSSKKAAEISEDSFDLEISPDEVRDLLENDDNLPGQMQFGMDEEVEKEEILEKEDKNVTIEDTEEDFEESPISENTFEEDAGDEEFHTVSGEIENPFEDEEEDKKVIEADFTEDEEDSEFEKAKKTVCNFGLFAEHTLGDIMNMPNGMKTIQWMASGYRGSNNVIKAAAKVIMEHENQQKLAA